MHSNSNLKFVHSYSNWCTSAPTVDNSSSLLTVTGIQEDYPPLNCTAFINGNSIQMKIDTGSSFSLINSNWWKQLGKPLLRRRPTLRDVSGSLVPVLGIGFVNVSLNGPHKQLRIVFLASSDTKSILGREWISAFSILSVPRDTQLNSRNRKTSGTSLSHSTSSCTLESNIDIDQPSHLIASAVSFPKKSHRASPADS